MKDIFELVKSGSLDEIKEIVETDKTLLKSKDFKKRNLIMLAAERGDGEIFDYLLSKKAPFKGSDSEKNTALHYAMKGNNFEIIKILVDKKIKPEQKNKDNNMAINLIHKKTTPEIFTFLTDIMGLKEFYYFYKSLYQGNLEIVKYLISKGDDLKLTEKQLTNIFRQINDFEVIKFIIEELKVDMSRNIIIDSFGELNTLQHYIDEYYLPDDEKLKIVKLLVDNGADINYLDHGKRDAMYYALKNNNMDIAGLLLKAGSSVERLRNYLLKFDDYHYDELRKSIKISAIRFILDNAGKIDLEKVKRKLLSAMKSSIDIPDNFLKYDNIENLKYFIKTFDLDIQEKYFKNWGDKYSFFTRAIYLNQIDKVKLFLEMGADINKIDSNGNPPIYYALDTDKESVLDLLNLLVENGADLNIRIGKKKNSLLLNALLKDGYYAAKFLFEHGLNFKLPINNFLKMKGTNYIPSFKVIKLLIDNGIELDTSDIEILTKIFLSVSENTDNLLYLLRRYNIDLNNIDNYYLTRILEKIIGNKDLTKEENLINFKRFAENFNLGLLTDNVKDIIIRSSVQNIEIFKILEDELNFELTDKKIIEEFIEKIISSAAVDTLNYILSKENIIVYDIYDTYKNLLRKLKKDNKYYSYRDGYEERAINFEEITKILKKYDKDLQKKVEKGEIEEKEEIKLTEEEELIEKLDAPWIDLNQLPVLFFKSGEKISAKTTLMLLLAIKSFGYQRVIEQIQDITKGSLLELFNYLRSEVSKEMWIFDLLLALAEDDVTIYPLLEEHIERYGYSGGYHLQNQLINKLVEIKNIEGLKFIYKLTKSKRNSIKNSANNAFRTKSYLLGVTIEELKDMLISDFGLNSDKELELDYGSRKITVKLMPDFKLTYTDKAINKTYKTLPKATKSDDAEKVKEATAFIKKMKKEIKKIVSDMKTRLNAQFTDPKFNKFSYWKQLFVENPVLNVFATNLFWGVYKDESLEKVFIYTEDGSFLDINQNETSLNESELISIVHPIELSEDELKKAKEFIGDYEITQPLTQINRQIFIPKDKKAKRLMDFNGKTVKTNTFHYALTKAGFSRGIVEDNGTIFTYYMDVRKIEVLVVMSGITIGFYDNDDIEIYEVIFRKDKEIELGKVDKRVFSEVYLTMISFT